MSEFKHTPGPWNLETVKTSCGICHKIGPFPSHRDGKESSSACIYVDYYSPGNPTHEELKANARLIAAAPDLLDALKAMVDRYAPSYHDCTDDGMPSCEIRDARAAIAKAKGEDRS